MTAIIERPPASSPPPVQPSRRQTGRVVLGLLVVAFGILWLADRLQWIDLRPGILLPVALIGVGLALMMLAWDAAHEGLIVLGTVLALVTLLVAVTPVGTITSGVGNQTHRVTSMAELEESYAVGAGQLTLDLTGLRMDGSREVKVEVGVGELKVIVPRSLMVEIQASSGLGEVRIFNQREEGFSVDRSFQSAGFNETTNRLLLDLDVGIGQVEVSR